LASANSIPKFPAYRVKKSGDRGFEALRISKLGVLGGIAASPAKEIPEVPMMPKPLKSQH
jgi:hypothetical protein